MLKAPIRWLALRCGQSLRKGVRYPVIRVWMTMCHCRRKTVIKGDTIKNQTNKNQTILFRYGDSINMLSFLLQNTLNVFHKGVGNKWRWVDLGSKIIQVHVLVHVVFLYCSRKPTLRPKQFLIKNYFAVTQFRIIYALIVITVNTTLTLIRYTCTCMLTFIHNL